MTIQKNGNKEGQIRVGTLVCYTDNEDVKHLGFVTAISLDTNRVLTHVKIGRSLIRATSEVGKAGLCFENIFKIPFKECSTQNDKIAAGYLDGKIEFFKGFDSDASSINLLRSKHGYKLDSISDGYSLSVSKKYTHPVFKERGATVTVSYTEGDIYIKVNYYGKEI